MKLVYDIEKKKYQPKVIKESYFICIKIHFLLNHFQLFFSTLSKLIFTFTVIIEDDVVFWQTPTFLLSIFTIYIFCILNVFNLSSVILLSWLFPFIFVFDSHFEVSLSIISFYAVI